MRVDRPGNARARIDSCHTRAFRSRPHQDARTAAQPPRQVSLSLERPLPFWVRFPTGRRAVTDLPPSGSYVNEQRSGYQTGFL